MFHKITAVAPLPDFRLLVHFTDGCAKEYDVRNLIEHMEAFRDLERIPGLFQQVVVDQGGYGILTWMAANCGPTELRLPLPLTG